MASRKEFLEYILEQLSELEEIAYRAMMGEYIIYYKGRIAGGLSGLSTGASWLCYYRVLQDGPASVVVPIDKLSILVTIAFSYIVFKEKLSKKSGPGLLLIVLGTFLMIVPTLSA